jgi:signal transduction histidine kinase
VLTVRDLAKLPRQALAESHYFTSHALRTVSCIGLISRDSVAGALSFGSQASGFSLSSSLLPELRILGATMTNVIAARRAEQMLIERTRELQAMQATLSADSHVVIVDRVGRVVSVNSGKRFDASKGSLLLNDVGVGSNYLEHCRQAGQNGFEPAAKALAAIKAVIDGSSGMFIMEYEDSTTGRTLQFSVAATDGDIAGAAISHKDVTQQRNTHTSLQDLSGRVIKAQEEERRRIARDLHDDLSQKLALISIEVEQIIKQVPAGQRVLVGRLRRLRERGREISLSVHELSHRLHPSKLDHLGLVAAINCLCNEILDHHSVSVKFIPVNIPAVIREDLALCVFRVVQESLHNVVKHSGVRKARLVLCCTGVAIHLLVSDEGRGFNVESPEVRAGIGLVSMSERVRLIGGTISIQSEPLRGTRIIAQVPLSLECGS